MISLAVGWAKAVSNVVGGSLAAGWTKVVSNVVGWGSRAAGWAKVVSNVAWVMATAECWQHYAQQEKKLEEGKWKVFLKKEYRSLLLCNSKNWRNDALRAGGTWLTTHEAMIASSPAS